MKTIGLIGGLSWESTTDYYRYINTFVKEELGGLHSAKCLLYSFDFEEIVELQHNGEWEKATQCMIDAAKTLENGGADVIVICTNTMHKMAREVEEAVGIPLIHIADATAVKIKEQNLKSVGLLGTNFTMEQDFYKERLAQHGIDVIIPDEEDRQTVHSVIFNELCKGEFKQESREAYLQVMNRLQEKGAEGVILGCTEIPLLVKQTDTEIPLFDTALLHAVAAAEFALERRKKPEMVQI
ncbi:aspartate/glutamate racemase family protein [Ectobacillus panaciterrae]|uniref:aspartate/glutamate racemase family protein n=1 Tax=Ectobacillus panaciterrae TaxID=363872 RepID=UPI0003FCB057|nr:aspartate/glutamate racemase family protein [Ectobacillus panaciterrae]